MKNKTWCIIGGSGSLGHALTRRILDTLEPKKIIIYSRGEVKQAKMREKFGDEKMRYIIGDVQDVESLRSALRGVDYVVLAAALKRVEQCEYNAIQAVKTNVNGTVAVVRAAIDCGVERVVFTSTDKACQAVNTYGATKFLAERIVINGNQYSGEGGTRFACTRYGNVSGSRGSVIPLWRDALEKGQPIKLTNPQMTRYWMTLEESVDLVLYAFAEMKGGEVFIPNLPAYDLQSLADAMTERENQEVIDVRPGEKTHETLVSQDEAVHGVIDHNGIIRLLPSWYERNDPWKALPAGFRMASDNAKRLEIKEIAGLLKKV